MRGGVFDHGGRDASGPGTAGFSEGAGAVAGGDAVAGPGGAAVADVAQSPGGIAVKKADALRVVLDFCREKGTPDVRAAAERLVCGPRRADAGVSERGRKFAVWFRGLLAADARLGAGWEEQWARCFDDLLRLDGRTAEQVAAVCGWARGHDFWRGVFLTPLKLRQRDGSGVMYFDRFAEGMKGKAGKAAKAETYGLRAEVRG